MDVCSHGSRDLTLQSSWTADTVVADADRGTLQKLGTSDANLELNTGT